MVELLNSLKKDEEIDTVFDFKKLKLLSTIKSDSDL